MLLGSFKDHWLNLVCLVTFNWPLCGWLSASHSWIDRLLGNFLLLYTRRNSWHFFSRWGFRSLFSHKLLPDKSVNQHIILCSWQPIKIVDRYLLHSFCQLTFSTSVLHSRPHRCHTCIRLILLSWIDLKSRRSRLSKRNWCRLPQILQRILLLLRIIL